MLGCAASLPRLQTPPPSTSPTTAGGTSPVSSALGSAGAGGGSRARWSRPMLQDEGFEVCTRESLAGDCLL